MRNTGISGIARIGATGALASALAAAAVLIAPAGAQATEGPAAPAQATAAPAGATLATGERLELTPGAKKGAAPDFRVLPAPGAEQPGRYAFAHTGGELEVQPHGRKQPVPSTTVKTGVASTSAAPAESFAGTSNQSVTFSVANTTAAAGSLMRVFNLSTWMSYEVDTDQYQLTGKASLPAGTYLALISYSSPQDPSYLLAKGFTVGSAPVSVVFDQAAAKEVGIVPDDPTARRASASVWLTTPKGATFGDAGGRGRTFVTPLSVTGVKVVVHEMLTKNGPATYKPTPYLYDLVHTFERTVPTTAMVKVATSSLAKTTTTLRAQAGDQTGTLHSYPKLPEVSPQTWAPLYMPSTITEYVTPGLTFGRFGPHGLTLADRTLTGTGAPETIGRAPFGPNSSQYGTDRTRYLMWIREPNSVGDADGNDGSAGGYHSMKLTSRGTVLGEQRNIPTSQSFASVTVPEEPTPYQLVHDVTRRARLSTRVTREWTFTSDGYSNTTPVGERINDLVDVTFDTTGLDIRNTAGTAPVTISAKAASRDANATATLTGLEYSLDDGATWTAVTVPGTEVSASAEVTVPATARFVSLRASGKDSNGATNRSTVIRAFAGPASTTLPSEQAGATTLTGLSVNGGKPIVLDGSYGLNWLEAEGKFTASDPAGIRRGSMYLYRGSYERPTGVVDMYSTGCTKTDAATSTCTFTTMLAPAELADNTLAGTWNVAAFAESLDGTSFVDNHAAGTVRIMRPTALTTDAGPEPVARGGKLTVTGTLTVSDWLTGKKVPYAGRPVTLEFKKAGTTTWSKVRTITTPSTGKVTTTLAAWHDGYWRLTSPATDTTTAVAGPADYVDVR
ncbi:hypothetical protein ACH44C_14980 [Streptomyces purpureus]|uniref:hypothetical protein n=1 Tax=Streptomyces purpureus TaxID=1951 RepID=UPI0037963E4D